MDILAIAQQGIRTLKTNAGNAIITFQFKKKIGSTHTNGRNSITFAPVKDLEGIFSKFKSNEIDNINVKTTDALVLLFIDNIVDVPNVGDEFYHGSTLYQVVKPMPTYVGNVIVICEVQLRT